MAFVTIKDKDNVTLGYLQTDAQERLGVHNLLHVQDKKAAGAAGGDFSSGAWRTRSLNTVVLNNILGASVSENQITLPPGTYFVDSSAPAFSVYRHSVRLEDISHSVTLLNGTVEYTKSECSNRSFCCGVLSIAEESTIELQHICTTTKTINGFGIDGGVGNFAIFSELKIWKLA